MPIVEHIQNMYTLFFYTWKICSSWQNPISFKGRVSSRVYNPQKPVKFVKKVFVVSTVRLVVYIIFYHTLVNKYRYKVNTLPIILKDTSELKIIIYTDRYYTSPELASELLKMNCFITGTVMQSRVGMPRDIKRSSKNLRKEIVPSFRKGNTMVQCWNFTPMNVSKSTTLKKTY